jgi:hypothetical protein
MRMSLRRSNYSRCQPLSLVELGSTAVSALNAWDAVGLSPLLTARAVMLLLPAPSQEPNSGRLFDCFLFRLR